VLPLLLLLLLLCLPHSYQKLAHDVKPGSSILCADGSIVLEVISTDPAAGTVRARCKNTAMLG
jgi:pyruvate kinase